VKTYASSATLSVLQSGLYQVAELFEFTLATGQTYRFTSFDVALSCEIYLPPQGSSPVGPYTFGTGLTIKRGTITQKAGTEAGNLKLTVAPQADSPSAPILINGYPFLQACDLGFFDNAFFRMSKLFMNRAVTGGANFPDTSPGAVGWLVGQVQGVQAGRLKAELTIDDYLALLGSQNMPRQLYGVGCYHQVYDAGCGLLKSAFTVTGEVTAVASGSAGGYSFSTNLTAADGYFDLGVLTFTSGANSAFAQNVSSYLNASGAIIMNFPFPVPPAVGDTFSIYPGCDLQQATCTTKFNNLRRFGGQPYIPDPSTIVDGDTQAPPQQPTGSQAGLIIGSLPSGTATYPPYKT